MQFSVVIPLFDEEENVERLLATVSASLEQNGYVEEYEILCVNDGSTDRTGAALRKHATGDTRIVTRAARGGKSAALAAGLEAARYDIVGLLDADLQTTPDDFEPMLERLEAGFDCAHGIRVNRQDNVLRRWSSRVANGIRRRILSDPFRDISCPLTVFRKQCLERVTLFEPFHRYIPFLIQMQGYRVAEVPVRHFPRIAGRAKYGVSNRIWIGVTSLLAVRWLARHHTPRILPERSDHDA